MLIIAFLIQLCNCTLLCQDGSIKILDAQQSGQILDQAIDQSILNYSGQYGYGIWMKYQPYASSNAESQEGVYAHEVNQQSYFIYSEQIPAKTQPTLLHTLEIDIDKQLITHQIAIQTTNNSTVYNISINPLKYEGRWLLFFSYYDLDNKYSQITLYDFQESSIIQQFVFNDYPLLADIVRYTVGGTYSFGEQVFYSKFPGKLTQWFTTGNLNLLETLDDLCEPLDVQKEFAYLFSGEMNNVELLNGQQYRQYTYNASVDCQRLEIKGWVRLDSLMIDSKDIEITLLRITINNKINDDSYLGDKFLPIQYYQSNILSKNWISVTTYTYQFPAKGYYTSEPSDQVLIREDFLKKALTEWHYLRFEYNRVAPNKQPTFTIFFPSIAKEVIFILRWSKEIRYFTGTKFYSYVGGDQFSDTNYYLKGQIFNMVMHGCYGEDIEFKIGCHYSCKSCIGPLSTQCLDCLDGSNRIYQPSQMNCICKLNYVDIDENPICQTISNIGDAGTMIELKPGYWRAYNYSEAIAECYRLAANCKGGWKLGDESCVEGHIGALCEQCDLYNIRSKGSFYVSSRYKCTTCSQTQINILTITLITLYCLSANIS